MKWERLALDGLVMYNRGLDWTVRESDDLDIIDTSSERGRTEKN